MFGAIIVLFVVVGIFSLVASVFTLYVWCVDRRQFALWVAMLRSRREAPEPAP